VEKRLREEWAKWQVEVNEEKSRKVDWSEARVLDFSALSFDLFEMILSLRRRLIGSVGREESLFLAILSFHSTAISTAA